MTTFSKCKSCQNQFSGNYCNWCGEKIIEEKDFSMRSIIGQAVGAITNLDSKLLRSIKLLFFYPGKLSVAFVEGIRVPYMKPFQLFVLANVFFFIFLSDIDIFRTPAKWFFSEWYDGIQVLNYVRDIAEKQSLSHEEIAIMYDAKSSELAKGLVILLVPIIALVGQLLNWRSKMAYGKHIIFAIHFFSFLLGLLVIWFALLKLVRPFIDFAQYWNIVPVIFLSWIYYAISTKRFYGSSWPVAILKGGLGIFLINFFVHLYRVGINLYTLNNL